KELFQKGIDSGIIYKYPARLIEHRIELFPLDSVSLVGYIDVLIATPEQAEVIDHKTTASLRYAKTPDKLKRSIKELIYCKAALEQFKRTGQKEPDEVRITHNIFVKDTGQVLSRSVSVSVALIEEAWNQAIKIVRRQRELHKLTRDQYIEAPVCEDQKSC